MGIPLNVLLVEDSADDAALILDKLESAGFETKWKRVETEADFLEEIRKSPDIILYDYSLPRFSGLRAAKILMESGLNIPFILISGTVGEEIAVEAIKDGASDFLLKDRIERLGSAVMRALEEKQLRDERARLQQELALQATALETAANGVLITDRLGTILWVNPAFTAVTGYTREEAVGKNPRILKPGEHDQEFYKNFWQTITSGETWRGEFINRRKNGSLYYDEHTITPVRSATGKITHFVGIMNDVTPRKRADNVLRESERRFREMLENVQLIAMTLDRSGKVTFCNDYLLGLTGWQREEVIGQNWFSHFVPATHPDIGELFRESIDSEKNFPPHYENPIKIKTGELREILWNNTMLRDANGNIIGSASIGEDVTERKRSEEELRKSEERFRQLAENINEVFWITNAAKNQMIYISPAYEKIWGRTCASLYQSPQTWSEAIHPDDRERILQASIDKEARGDYDEIYRIVRPDGSLRWIHDRAFPLLDDAGRMYRTVGTAEDITRQRELEEQFRQAQKMESIGQLASGVAHDFNNLLTVINCYSQLLMESPDLPSDAGEMLKEVFTAGERAAKLTQQLLTFSRKQAIRTELIDLNEIVTDVAKMLRRLIGENIELQMSMSEGLPPITADVGMMDQVLMNLAVNARDAMPKGGRLSISTKLENIDEQSARKNSEARPGRFACLYLRDTGCGMSPQVLARIFEPFFTTKEIGKGTGLGLATVFGIVKQHNGWIEVESEPGSGTTFKVFLPVTAQTAAQPGDVAAAQPQIGTETILLVEDEDALRDMALMILQKYGYRVLEATSGPDALQVWEQHRGKIDLLLTDMVLPGGMTGHELAEKLKAFNPALKAIYTSGYSEEMSGLVSGLRDKTPFLQKPYHPQKLAAAIRTCLDSK